LDYTESRAGQIMPLISLYVELHRKRLMRCKSLSYPTDWKTVKPLRIKLSKGAQNAYC